MKAFGAIVMACVLAGLVGGCAASHDFEVYATNLGDEPIDMKIEHVQGGRRTVKFLSQIAPGVTSSYEYRMRSKQFVRCEARFTTLQGSSALLDVEDGAPLSVNVEDRDGQIVVTDRPE